MWSIFFKFNLHLLYQKQSKRITCDSTKWSHHCLFQLSAIVNDIFHCLHLVCFRSTLVNRIHFSTKIKFYIVLLYLLTFIIRCLFPLKAFTHFSSNFIILELFLVWNTLYFTPCHNIFKEMKLDTKIRLNVFLKTNQKWVPQTSLENKDGLTVMINTVPRCM